MMEEDESEGRYWKTDPPQGEQLRVRLRVLRVANSKQVLKRDWLLEDPVLQHLMMLKTATATNYHVDKQGQAQRLRTGTSSFLDGQKGPVGRSNTALA